MPTSSLSTCPSTSSTGGHHLPPIPLTATNPSSSPPPLLSPPSAPPCPATHSSPYNHQPLPLPTTHPSHLQPPAPPPTATHSPMALPCHPPFLQVMCNLLSLGNEEDPEVMSMNGAAAALVMSSIPWGGPMGAARVCLVGDSLIANPPGEVVSSAHSK